MLLQDLNTWNIVLKVDMVCAQQTVPSIKHGRIPVKVRSQHINADNCGHSNIRKSENTDFYQYPQLFGDVSQKLEDM